MINNLKLYKILIFLSRNINFYVTSCFPFAEPLNEPKIQLKIFIDKTIRMETDKPRHVEIEIAFVNGIFAYKTTSKSLSNNETSSLSVQCPTVESMYYFVEDKTDYWTVTITKTIATPVASPDPPP